MWICIQAIWAGSWQQTIFSHWLCSHSRKQFVVFATVAITMGVDIFRHLPCYPYWTSKYSEAYFQEPRCTGTDGKLSSVFLYYDNREIVKNKMGMPDDMCNFCTKDKECLRKLL